MAGGTSGTIKVGDITYYTMKDAMLGAEPGDTVILNGDFETGLHFTKKVNVVISGKVTITGTDKQGTGMSFGVGGATVKCEDGATLTISKFDVGLNTSNVVVKDGTYILDENGYGFRTDTESVGGTKDTSYSAGTFEGSTFSGLASEETLRTSLNISAKNCDKVAVFGTYTNCTVEASSVKGYRTWGSPGIIANNSVIHTEKVCIESYQPISLNNSTLWADGEGYSKVTGIMFVECWTKTGTITNHSLLKATNWNKSYAGKGITTTYETLTIDGGSKVIVDNNKNGGFNVNSGAVIFDNATLEASNHKYVHFGVQGAGTLTILGDSLFKLDQSAQVTGGGTEDLNNYIILGGSVPYKSEDIVVKTGGYTLDTIPTNGPEHQNEDLHLFTMGESLFPVTTDTLGYPADPSKKYSIEMVDIDGDSYEYSVANVNPEDHIRYVWGPAAQVTFDLRNTAASFGDGSKLPKDMYTLRGYTLEDVGATGVPAISSIQTGADKEGISWEVENEWYYMDGGEEKVFDQETTTFYADTTVYPKWKNAKAVVYHSNHETQGAQDHTALYRTANETAPILEIEEIIEQTPAFEQIGYHVVSWNTDPGGNATSYGVKDETLDLPGKEDLHLYAQWNINKYTVMFHTNKDDLQVDPQTVDHGGVAVDPGLNILGLVCTWYNNEEFTGSKWKFDNEITENVELYAKWTVDSKTVRFYSNDSDKKLPASVVGKFTNGSAIGEVVPGIVPDWERNGYKFAGWYSDKPCSDGNEINISQPTIMTSSFIYLYAKWVADTIPSVTYHSNVAGDTKYIDLYEQVDATKATVLSLSDVQGKSAGFNPPDYEFTGWKDQDETPCGVGSELDLAEKSDWQLYAQWNPVIKPPVACTVTFDTGADGTAVAPQTVNAGELAMAPTDPVRDGYTFGGWYAMEDYSGNPWKFNVDTVEESMTLHAKWIPFPAFDLQKKAEILVDAMTENEKSYLTGIEKYQLPYTATVTMDSFVQDMLNEAVERDKIVLLESAKFEINIYLDEGITIPETGSVTFTCSFLTPEGKDGVTVTPNGDKYTISGPLSAYKVDCVKPGYVKFVIPATLTPGCETFDGDISLETLEAYLTPDQFLAHVDTPVKAHGTITGAIVLEEDAALAVASRILHDSSGKFTDWQAYFPGNPDDQAAAAAEYLKKLLADISFDATSATTTLVKLPELILADGPADIQVLKVPGDLQNVEANWFKNNDLYYCKKGCLEPYNITYRATLNMDSGVNDLLNYVGGDGLNTADFDIIIYFDQDLEMPNDATFRFHNNFLILDTRPGGVPAGITTTYKDGVSTITGDPGLLRADVQDRAGYVKYIIPVYLWEDASEFDLNMEIEALTLDMSQKIAGRVTSNPLVIADGEIRGSITLDEGLYKTVALALMGGLIEYDQLSGQEWEKAFNDDADKAAEHLRYCLDHVFIAATPAQTALHLHCGSSGLGALTIEKTVKGLQGAAASQNHPFTFTIVDAEGVSRTETITVMGNTDGKVEIAGLTPGSYTVTETDYAVRGYDRIDGSKLDITVEVNADDTAVASFTNEYAPGDPGDPSDPSDPDPKPPIGPVDPSDPMTPVDPSDPMAPLDPSDPMTPVDPSDPMAPVDPEKDKTPGTGDIRTPWAVAAAVSGMGLAWLGLTRKKREEDDI